LAVATALSILGYTGSFSAPSLTMLKFAALVQFFVSAIEHGSYRPGDALPSLRAVCASHGVSMNTSKRAYYELERLGYVEALPRAGFRVIAAGPTAALQTPAAAWGSPFVNPALFDSQALGRAAAKVMRQYPDALARHEPLGLDTLRRQIARRYLAQGVALDWDRLLITCGAMEALMLAVQAVTLGQAAPRLALVTPAFPGLLGLLAQHGIATLDLPSDADGGFDLALLEWEAAAGALNGVVVMPNFQHPTGQCLPSAQRQALLALSRRYQLPIIEDDTYRELYFGRAAPLPLKAEDTDGLVLSCCSFSKSLAPGYRVGWLAPGRFYQAVSALKLSHTLASPLPSQLALAELLAGAAHETALVRLRHSLAQRVAAMRAMLLPQLPAGAALSEPQGGYFLWLTLPAGCDLARLQAAAQARGVHFAAGALCYPDGAGPAALRLNASYFDAATQGEALAWLARELVKH
jgi:DNA-binding transcriptional MocR family regulator